MTERRTKHTIRVVEAGPREHHVNRTDILFTPRCSCGWEGAWVYTHETATFHGKDHKQHPGWDGFADRP